MMKTQLALSMSPRKGSALAAPSRSGKRRSNQKSPLTNSLEAKARRKVIKKPKKISKSLRFHAVSSSHRSNQSCDSRSTRYLAGT
jgi:hypothetical protein